MENKTKSWVLESGTSFHGTLSRILPEKYVLGNLGKVYLGGDQTCDGGNGEVQINLSGSVWKLNKVRNAPNLMTI